MNCLFKTSCIVLCMFIFASCSKKTIPEKTVSNTETPETKTVVYRRVTKTPTPKSIVVNDKAAMKTVDGRSYYDLEGKRYWRNKRDGKYYLYYKGIFDNKDFQ